MGATRCIQAASQGVRSGKGERDLKFQIAAKCFWEKSCGVVVSML